MQETDVTSPRSRLPFHSFLAVTILALVAAVACGGDGPPAEPPAEEKEPAAPTEPATATPSLDPSILDDPSRSDDDRYRDEGFKPLEVYGFLEVQPGATVVDLWPGGGYNTHILSHAVGDDGRVLAVLGPLYTRGSYEDRVRSQLQERIDAGGLDNVEIVGPITDVPEGSVDVAITVRNYHDLGDAEARTAVLPDVMRMLKPGGILGVVDAHTPEGVDEENHRMAAELAIDEITAAGFELVDTSDVLANPADTYDFDGREGLDTPDDVSDDAPIHRYFIHRFVQKYRKPAEASPGDAS